MAGASHTTSCASEIFSAVETKIETAKPLVEHVKGLVEKYAQTRKYDKVTIVGSVGNNLYFPEIHDNETYCVEVDMIFERHSENLHLPVAYEDEMMDTPVLSVYPVKTPETPSDYVWLKAELRDTALLSFDKKHYFELDETSGTYYLQNTPFRDDVLPVDEEVLNRNIMGEKELAGTFTSRLKVPFRTYRSDPSTWERSKDEWFRFFCLIDKVAAINIPWPEQAQQWTARASHRKWPTQGVIQEIVARGCHVIPKISSGERAFPAREWKYSFAVAEQRLAHSLSRAQRLSFLTIKQLKRKHLDLVSLSDGAIILSSGLTTYHLKTTMFWISEESEASVWEQHPIQGIAIFLDRLVSYLRNKHLPNYFIPEINILKRVWVDERVNLYVKNEDDYRDTRLGALIEKVDHLRINLHKYLGEKDILCAVDQSHEQAASKELYRDSFMGKMRFDHSVLHQDIHKLGETVGLTGLTSYANKLKHHENDSR